jgi:hypothetical protein
VQRALHTSGRALAAYRRHLQGLSDEEFLAERARLMTDAELMTELEKARDDEQRENQ